jgi:hypothetical protein
MVEADAMTLRWQAEGPSGGRLVLADAKDGAELAVRAFGGAGATVAFADGALELGGRLVGADDATLALELRASFDPAVVWIPHLAPAPENVIGDAVFRAPAVLLADHERAVALIPDLDDVAAAKGFRAWLDYDHPARTFTLAAGSYRIDGHVFFVREPTPASGAAVRLRLHVLASTRAEDIANPYGMAARWLWERWGRPGHRVRPMPSIARILKRIEHWAFAESGWGDTVWQEVDLGGPPAGGPVFIVDVSQHPSIPPAERRWRERRSIWNQAWFSTQRCANGLLRYARQSHSTGLADRARKMTELALAAPDADGLFPSVLVADDAAGTWSWSNSDRRPPSVSASACHVVDAAFTCRMLLEWRELTGEPRALSRAVRFAERLVRLQRPSGAFPGWVEPDGRVPPELADGPESAVSATLLLRLGGAELREAALRTLPLLDEIASVGRWEDFETYYSCAPWGAPELLGRRVPRNGVFKQNTLSIAWTAEAFFEAFRATGERRWLDRARRCLDELSLYQAVWDPPWLPAPAHGGFGVMNADSEWNDARQSLFAPLYLEIGRATGDAELVERGVSALRASFSMLYAPENQRLLDAYERRFPFFGRESYGFMMENQAHGSAEPIGTFTIFTWGNGSALAAAATVRDRFPEVARAYGFAP